MHVSVAKFDFDLKPSPSSACHCIRERSNETISPYGKPTGDHVRCIDTTKQPASFFFHRSRTFCVDVSSTQKSVGSHFRNHNSLLVRPPTSKEELFEAEDTRKQDHVLESSRCPRLGKERRSKIWTSVLCQPRYPQDSMGAACWVGGRDRGNLDASGFRGR